MAKDEQVTAILAQLEKAPIRRPVNTAVKTDGGVVVLLDNGDCVPLSHKELLCFAELSTKSIAVNSQQAATPVTLN